VTTPPDPAWVDALRGRFRGELVASSLRFWRSVDSTNDRAREWLDAGGPDGLVVLAGEQTAGRGRRGRSWSSPPGMGLYLSVGCRPELPSGSAGWLTFLGAVAAAEALRGSGVEAEIRWPNDLDARGRKIAGVLAESRFDGTRLASAVVGIGINVGQRPDDFPPDMSARATSVRLERGKVPPAEALAGDLLERLGHWYGELQVAGADGGGSRLLERWRELAPGHTGQAVVVESEGEILRGTTRGIEPDGALVLECEDGRRRPIRVGELRRLRVDEAG